MDTIHITDISCYGYSGYLPEERVLGQWFEVDLTISLDLSAACHSDRLEDTLDYRKAIAIVREQIQNSKFALVEKLAQAIADEILKLNSVRRVRVQLSKPAAPIPDFGGNIMIDITRSLEPLRGEIV
jgi:dihydroneopterin aldolase